MNFQLKSRTAVPGLLAAEELEPKCRDCSNKAYTYIVKPTYREIHNEHLNYRLNDMIKS